VDSGTRAIIIYKQYLKDYQRQHKVQLQVLLLWISKENLLQIAVKQLQHNQHKLKAATLATNKC
jgi:hypothetical protein